MSGEFEDKDFFDPFADKGDLDPILDGIDQINQERKDAKEKDSATGDQPTEAAAPSKYTQQQLLEVFDAIVFEGEYRQTFVGRGIKVTFRSRTGKDAVEISRALDRFEGKSFMSVQTYANLLTLIYSVVDLNGVDFTQLEVKDKYNAITRQADAFNSLLFGKLAEFDEKISMAVEEGRRNF